MRKSIKETEKSSLEYPCQDRTERLEACTRFDGIRDFGDGTDFDVFIPQLGAFGLELDFSGGERLPALALIDGRIEDDHVDGSVDKVDVGVSEAVDFDGVPFSVWFFGINGFPRAANLDSFFVGDDHGPSARFEVILLSDEFYGDVGADTAETDEVTGVAFHDFAFEAGHPDFPEIGVVADAVVKEAGIAFGVEARFPALFAPLELEGEVVVFEGFLGDNAGVDFSGDVEEVLIAFFLHLEDVFRVFVEADGCAFADVLELRGSFGESFDAGVGDTHEDIPVGEFGVEESFPASLFVSGEGGESENEKGSCFVHEAENNESG